MKSFVSIAAALLFAAVLMQAQGTASIDGTVADSTQSLVPSAKVTLTNVDTGQARSASVSGQGFFTFTNLNPGKYSVKVSAAGFKNWEQNDVVLTVEQHATVHPSLELGSVSETVQVNAAPPLVTTSDSSVSTLIDIKRIQELPLNGRNALQLVGLAPGVVATGTQGQFGAQQVTFASGGGRDIDVNYSLDGGFNINQFFGIPNEYPNPDALQEFAVSSRNYSAQFGRGTSSVSAATRSGTNELHGSAFWFLRNTDLDSRAFFAPSRPVFKRNQYGATVGGPIIKNKLFFFVGYQGTKVRGSPGTQAYTTLTAAQRGGDFSTLNKPIIDPTTGQQFPGNIISPSRIQPQATKFLQQFLPAANTGASVYNFTVATKLDQNQVIGKVDYLLTQNDHVSVRYLFNDVPQTSFAGGSGSALGPGWISDLPTRFQNSTVSYLHTFSPSLLNDAHITYMRSAFGVLPLLNFSLSGLGYPINTGNAFSDFGLIPDASLGVTGYFTGYEGAPTRDVAATWQVSDNVSWVHGRNNFNFGMDLYHNRVNELQNFNTGGALSFNGQFTGNAAADFLIGNFSSYQQIGGLSARLHQTLPSFYAQDDFKVSRRVTVNAGLRWDIDRGYRSEDGQLSTFRAGVQSTVFSNAPLGLLFPGDAGLPENIVGTRWNDLAPRVGIAWDVFGNGKTSIRAGFGIYYSPFTRGISLNRFTLIQPYTVNISISNGGNANNIFAGAPFNGVNPFPRPTAADLAGLKKLSFIPTAGESALALPFKTQASNEWSFSIQQQLWRAAVLEVNYVGSGSSHLTTSVEGNPAVYTPGVSTTGNTQQRRLFPAIGGINVIASALSSHYNSLQVSFRQNYSHGVSLQSSYTWSRALGVSGAQGEGSNGPRDPFNYNLSYGPLSFDLPQYWVNSFLWQPTANLHLSNRLVSALVKGWGLTGIITIHSGTPLSLTSGRDNSLTGIGGDTPDLIGSAELPDRSKAQQIQQWFNPKAFAVNGLGTYGTLGIGALRNPGYWNFDTAFQRVFTLHEGYTLELRGSLYNSFNHANLGAPTSNLQSPSFGQILSTTDPRVIEFGLRFAF